VSPKPKRYAALYAAYLLGFDLTILAASLLLKFNVKKKSRSEMSLLEDVIKQLNS